MKNLKQIFCILAVISLSHNAGATDLPDGLRPVLAPADAPSQFAAWQKSKGGADSLACEPIWGNDALLCFRIWEGKKRRWVTESDLTTWGATTSQVRGHITLKAREHLNTLVAKKPKDLPGEYYELVHGDGWSASALLLPDLVSERLGIRHFLAAAPTESILFTWAPGNAELDAAIGIAVKDTFEKGQGAVTPVVYYWTGEVWSAFGEAKPRQQ